MGINSIQMKIELDIPDELFERFKRTTAKCFPRLPQDDSVIKGRLIQRIEDNTYDSITNWALENSVDL